MKPTFLRSLILSIVVLCSLSSNAEARWWRSFFWTPPPPPPTYHPPSGGGGTGGGGGGGGSTPAIPEPASMVLMGVGTAAMLYVRQRRRRGNVDAPATEDA